MYLDQTAAFYESPVDYLRSRFPATVDPSFPTSPHPTSTPGVPAASYKLEYSLSNPNVKFMDDWRHSWPEYLAMFGVLPKSGNSNADAVQKLLSERGYHQVWRTWNGFEEDEKRRGGVEVWRWHKSF